MGPTEGVREAEPAIQPVTARAGVSLALLAVWLIRVSAALVLALPLLLLALWLF